MPLTERQQLAYLLSMTAKENKAAEDSNDDVTESRKVKKAKLSPVSSINRPRNKNGETQLHICTMKGELESIKNMVKLGADVNCRDNANWTPLHEACNHGHYKIAKFLLKSGANVNAAGLEGDTPLHDASSNGHLKIVLLLLRHGADPHHKNDNGESPIDVAEGEEVVEALQNFTKEMLKDLKPKKDYNTPEKHQNKEDDELIKKSSHKSSKSHKKTISNIDDFLETSSPVHHSKEVTRDEKRSYEKTHCFKTDNTDKVSMKSKKDSERTYIDSDSSSLEGSSKYSDGSKKTKTSSKQGKHREGYSADYKSEKVMKKSNETETKHEAFNAERKRHHSESSSLVGCGKKIKDGSNRTENKLSDKRVDDSDDDIALASFVTKDFKDESHHHNPKKVRKHSLSLDSEVNEKYYVKDEREFDRKLSEFSKIKDQQLHKKSDSKYKDEISHERPNDFKSQSKHGTFIPVTGFSKALKDSYSNIERKSEKSSSKKTSDPRRGIYSGEEAGKKKLSHSFSGSEYKSEKILNKMEQGYKALSSENSSIGQRKIEDASPKKDVKNEKSIDKQTINRERKFSGGSGHEEQRESHKSHQLKKVKGGVFNEFKSVPSADHSLKYGLNDAELVKKERREKSPFIDSKDGMYSHLKKVDSKGMNDEKMEYNEGKLDKSLNKKQEYLLKAKKTSEMLNKTYLGETSRSKNTSYMQEDKTSPEYHDSSVIKKTYSKFDKPSNREHDKKLSVNNQDSWKQKQKSKHKMSVKQFLLKGEEPPSENRLIDTSAEHAEESLKAQKELVKLKKDKQAFKEKTRKDSNDGNDSKADVAKIKSNLTKYKNFLDDSDEESEKHIHYDNHRSKHQGIKSDISSSSGMAYERKDVPNRSLNELNKDKEKVLKKEPGESHNEKGIGIESYSLKDYSEKTKQLNPQFQSKMESDCSDGYQKKKSSNKEKFGRPYISEFDNSNSTDDYISRKSEINQNSIPETPGESLDMTDLNSSFGKESIIKKADIPKINHKNYPISQPKFNEKASLERSLSIEGSEKHDSSSKHVAVGKSKSVDISISENKSSLDKEKRKKEKMNKKLKKSVSLYESVESTQKHSETYKDKEKKYDVEKGFKALSNKDIPKSERQPQDISSANKSKPKDMQEGKPTPKVKHGKPNQELDSGDKSHDYFSHVTLVSKTKSKESSHEIKGYMKMKETVKSECGLSTGSSVKSKIKDDDELECSKETKCKVSEIRKKHETLRSIPDPKSITADHTDPNMSQTFKDSKYISTHLPPPKYKCNENQDSDCTVEYEDTESSEDIFEMKELLSRESMLKPRENDGEGTTDASDDSLNRLLSSESYKKTFQMSDTFGRSFDVKLGADVKIHKDKDIEIDRSDCKKESSDAFDKSFKASNNSIEKDLKDFADEIGLTEVYQKSHIGILDEYLETKDMTIQNKRSISSDSSTADTSMNFGSFSTKGNLDAAFIDAAVLEKQSHESKSDYGQTFLDEKSKKEEIQDHSLLSDVFENDDKIIEEHILTCGPKLDKPSKHKLHSCKRDYSEQNEQNSFRKKHKRKQSDESSTNMHHGCSKTKKSRSLDSDFQENKASHLSTPLKESKSFPSTVEEISPKKRHKQSKSSDGTESKYKVYESSDASSTKHTSDVEHISSKFPRHGSKDEKSKSCGMKIIDSSKLTDSLPTISPIKTEFKACVRAINAKDSDKAAKLKEVDLNMNLGLNDTALELVKKKKRKRNSDSKDSNSDLRVLKVPTESISVENIRSPDETKPIEAIQFKDTKIHHASSNQNQASKLEDLPANSKIIKTVINLNTEVSRTTGIHLTSTADVKLKETPSKDIKSAIHTNIETDPLTDVPAVPTGVTKSIEDPVCDINLPEICSAETEPTKKETLIPEMTDEKASLIEKDRPEGTTTDSTMSTTPGMRTSEMSCDEVNLLHTSIKETEKNEHCYFKSSEESGNLDKLFNISCNDANMLEVSNNDNTIIKLGNTDLSQNSVDESKLADVSNNNLALNNESLYGKQSKCLSLTKIEVDDTVLSVEVKLFNATNTVKSLSPEGKMEKIDTFSFNKAKPIDAEKVLLELSPPAGLKNDSSIGSSSQKFQEFSNVDEKIMLPSSDHIVSTCTSSMGLSRIPPATPKEEPHGEILEKYDMANVLSSPINSSCKDASKFADKCEKIDQSKVTQVSSQKEIEGLDVSSIPCHLDSGDNKKKIGPVQNDENKMIGERSSDDANDSRSIGLCDTDTIPLSQTDESVKITQEISLPDAVYSIPDMQKPDNSFAQYNNSKNDELNVIAKEPELHHDDAERNEENENAVVNLLNMNREIDSMISEDNVNSISSSMLMMNSSDYIQKEIANKGVDSYVEDNNDGFCDDSSQGSACSTSMDLENKKMEAGDLSNIFDQLNDITKSISQNQFSEPLTQISFSEQVHKVTEGDTLQAISNKINTSIISLAQEITSAPEITYASDLTSVLNVPVVCTHNNLIPKHVNETSSVDITDYCPENMDHIKIDPIETISKMSGFEAPPDNEEPNIPFDCVQKENEKAVSESLSALSGNNELGLKNDEFSELILSGNLTTAASFGQRHIDLDSIDTSDLLKPEKSDILSTSSDSIILKKDLIDGQLGFSTNLSSDEIISKFADCILELDDTDNTYSLREYIPPPMDCSGGQQEKQFISTISSVVPSISLEDQCNNIPINQNLVMNQFYPSTDPMYIPNVLEAAINDISVAPVSVTESVSTSTSLSQPLTVNTVTTRLSTSDDKLYSSPKHIFARGKIYSPKTSVTSSSNGQNRRVSIEPCDMLRSIIESDIPVVPEPAVPSLPTIQEEEQENVKDNNKVENTSTAESGIVKAEPQVTVTQSEKPVILPPRLRNWREAVQRRCTRLSHAVNARDLDISLQKVIREPKYEEVLEKAVAYNLPQDMVMRHASEKERLRIHMVQEWCRAEQSVDLLRKEKGPLSGMSVLYYQKDHVSRKLGNTLDFKSKATIKPDYDKLRHARLTDLEDKLERMQQDLEKRQQSEIDAYQKVEQLDTIFDQKAMLRRRYLRFRNKISV